MPSLPCKHSQPASKAQKHEPQGADRQAARTHHTASREWQEIRRPILVRDHFRCKLCRKPGKEIDHKDGDPSNNEPDNLQTLCKPCHSSKTARENKGFGNAKR